MVFKRKLVIYFDSNKLFFAATFNIKFSNFGNYILVLFSLVTLACVGFHVIDFEPFEQVVIN